MMPREPQQAPIEAVRVDREYGPRIIVVTDTDGRDWRYYQESRGALVLGFPYIMSDGKYVITVFVPAAAGHMPILLDVKPYD